MLFLERKETNQYRDVIWPGMMIQGIHQVHDDLHHMMTSTTCSPTSSESPHMKGQVPSGTIRHLKVHVNHL